MERIIFDYHVDTESPVTIPDETFKGVVDQSPVGSVYQINPKTGHLDDVLSQIVQDPSKAQYLGQFLQKVGTDVVNHLSDEDLMNMVRSRYIDSPSEVADFAERLRYYIDSNNVPVDNNNVEPQSEPSTPAADEPAKTD